jgi:DNA-binding protein YbaB
MTPEERMGTRTGHDSDQDIEIALMKAHIEQMQKDVSEIKASVSDLVDTWKSAGVMVSLVKTAAAVVLAVGVIVGAFHVWH